MQLHKRFIYVVKLSDLAPYSLIHRATHIKSFIILIFPFFETIQYRPKRLKDVLTNLMYQSPSGLQPTPPPLPLSKKCRIFLFYLNLIATFIFKTNFKP